MKLTKEYSIVSVSQEHRTPEKQKKQVSGARMIRSVNEKWVDYKKLVQNVQYLTSMSIVHLDSWATTPEGKQAVRQWVAYLVESGKQFGNLDRNDPGQMQRNLQAVLNWVHQTIPKVDQVFRKYLPEDRVPPTVKNCINLYMKIVGSP